MSLRVITPPAPIVTPADIAGTHGAEDAGITRMIAAATRTIDGPQGWLGRCLGPQTLELTLETWCGWTHVLPCGPVIEVLSVGYVDVDGAEQTLDAAFYRRNDDCICFSRNFAWPVLGPWPGSVRIRYRAGYDGTTTGEVPPEAIQAVILMVQQMKSTAAENLFLRSVEIPDVETRTYTISDAADGLVQRAVENLLAGLRVYRL